MTEHLGSCLCGTVRFKVEGAFDSLYLCHCQHCKKDTGSAHAANLFSQSAKLSWQSGADAVTSFTLPGTRHGRSFCKFCGSALPTRVRQLSTEFRLFYTPKPSIHAGSRFLDA